MSTMSYLHSNATTPNQYCSINDIIKRNARTSSDTEAFIYRRADGSRETITFLDLFEKAKCVARYLIASGVQRLDNVGLFGPNTISRIVAEFGILLAGAVVLQLNSDAKNSSDLVEFLEKTDCRIVFADPGVDDVLLPIVRNLENKPGNGIQQKYKYIFLRKSTSNIVHTLLDDVQIASSSSAELPEVYPEDDALIFTTSGSTGKPKMVVHSHFNFTGGYLSNNDKAKTMKRYYNDRPFCWIGGSVATPTVLGGTVVFTDSKLGTTGKAINEIWKILAEENIDCAMLFPYHLFDLIDKQNIIADDGFRLKVITTSGQIINSCYTQVIDRFCKMLFVGYGSTEVLAISNKSLHRGDCFETGNVGKPSTGVEVRIVSENGRVVPIGEEGEIQVRCCSLMKRYYGDETMTNSAFTTDRPNWFRTGDIGSITSSGDLVVHGKIKENISRGGRKVLPGMVDDVIKTLDGIRHVATVAVPDVRLFEEVCVCYVSKDGVDLTSSDVQRHCENSFSSEESSDAVGSMPKYFLRFDEFPMLFNGKIDKQELKRQAAKQLNLS
ncbi:medium-chain acyl-CoA ligase ACSF2, mitochondrial-like [Ylistrum balloti]|uniref:medium-chain acyl-CoA ligase ACSF2, mitochondrial-like n=1 Tax=Ylistrum balloti TaxID=509963 RepID=UPI002905E95C|nr:medium-chain acyl-CoA ligase ACSF2, mitochondrial-like [Ylistrum balloti]